MKCFLKICNVGHVSFDIVVYDEVYHQPFSQQIVEERYYRLESVINEQKFCPLPPTNIAPVDWLYYKIIDLSIVQEISSSVSKCLSCCHGIKKKY